MTDRTHDALHPDVARRELGALWTRIRPVTGAAASEVHRTWSNTIVIDVVDIQSEMALLIWGDPARYLSRERRRFMRRNLVQDANRLIGTRMGVPRPDPKSNAAAELVASLNTLPDVATYDPTDELDMPDQYPYLWAHRVEGLSIAELAERDGVSRRTVDSRLAGERDRIAPMLETWCKGHRPRRKCQPVEKVRLYRGLVHEPHDGCELGADVCEAVVLPSSTRRDGGYCPESSQVTGVPKNS